jgi:hypothetical protein
MIQCFGMSLTNIGTWPQLRVFFIRCVILFILIIDDEYNYNLKPLIDVRFDVSHLK